MENVAKSAISLFTAPIISISKLDVELYTVDPLSLRLEFAIYRSPLESISLCSEYNETCRYATLYRNPLLND